MTIGLEVAVDEIYKQEQKFVDAATKNTLEERETPYL